MRSTGLGAGSATAPATAAWGSPLGDLPPSAEGPLTLTVECRTGPRRRGRPHEVTLGPDWSLTTPHDLDAERVALAFGGYLSCVLLADRVVPAVRARTQLLARRRLPPVLACPDGGWLIAGCRCRGEVFLSPDRAARHAREEHHAAHLAPEAPVRLLSHLGAAIAAAHPPDTWRPTARRDVRALVREPHGLADLWEAGIPPEQVVQLHARLAATEPLPTRLYVAATYRGTSLDWLRDVLAAGADGDAATWCAETGTAAPRRSPEVALAWLRLGLPRADVEQLWLSDYLPADADQLATLLRISCRHAAGLLAGWRRAGCRPRVAQLAAALACGGQLLFVPNTHVLDMLRAQSRDLGPRPDRTELALALAGAGTVPGALRDLAAEREARRTTSTAGPDHPRPDHPRPDHPDRSADRP